MKEKNETAEYEENEETRGIVVIQIIRNFTSQNKIARKHGFKVANKTGRSVKDLTAKAKTPLGDKNSHVIYNIPCGSNKYSYKSLAEMGIQTKGTPHKSSPHQDLDAGNNESANTKMNTNDGGLAKHISTCTEEIDWKNAMIVGREQRWTQRKLRG